MNNLRSLATTVWPLVPFTAPTTVALTHTSTRTSPALSPDLLSSSRFLDYPLNSETE